MKAIFNFFLLKMIWSSLILASFYTLFSWNWITNWAFFHRFWGCGKNGTNKSNCCWRDLSGTKRFWAVQTNLWKHCVGGCRHLWKCVFCKVIQNMSLLLPLHIEDNSKWTKIFLKVDIHRYTEKYVACCLGNVRFN